MLWLLAVAIEFFHFRDAALLILCRASEILMVFKPKQRLSRDIYQKLENQTSPTSGATLKSARQTVVWKHEVAS
jgi:hypothetical protein